MTDPSVVLYQDDDVVIVDKPADLLVHRTALDGGNDAVLQRVRDQLGQWLYPVHRLDRPTSGALAFALHPEAANRLAADFRSQGVAKHYLAIVRGWPPEHGVIERPLRPDRPKVARPSRSRFVRLATTELPIPVSRFPTTRYSLVMVAPDTGRRHQIRRHLKGIAHPVLGDTAHGDRHHNRFFREHFDSHRLLLHAWRLAVRQPSTGRWLAVEAPPPATFERLAEVFGWRLDPTTLTSARERMPEPGDTVVTDTAASGR